MPRRSLGTKKIGQMPPRADEARTDEFQGGKRGLTASSSSSSTRVTTSGARRSRSPNRQNPLLSSGSRSGIPTAMRASSAKPGPGGHDKQRQPRGARSLSRASSSGRSSSNLPGVENVGPGQQQQHRRRSSSAGPGPARLPSLSGSRSGAKLVTPRMGWKSPAGGLSLLSGRPPSFSSSSAAAANRTPLKQWGGGGGPLAPAKQVHAGFVVTPGPQARSSAIGTRSMLTSDKAYLRQTERELAEFCRAHSGVPNAFDFMGHGPKDFPLDSTNFKTVFCFLVRFLLPDFPDLARGFEAELPVLLKKLGYPVHVSKQVFQTLGTPHSWPTILHILTFLMAQVETFSLVSQHTSAVALQALDDNGFPAAGEDEEDQQTSEGLLAVEFLVGSYNRYMNGQDDFSEDLDRLRDQLLEREGLDPASVDAAAIEAEYEADLQRCQALEARGVEARQRLAKDEVAERVCVEDVAKLEGHVDDIKARLAALEEGKDRVAERARQLDASNTRRLVELRAWQERFAADNGSWFLDDDQASQVLIALKKGVGEKEEARQKTQDLIWKLEMEVSSLANSADKVVGEFDRAFSGGTLGLDGAARTLADKCCASRASAAREEQRVAAARQEKARLEVLLEERAGDLEGSLRPRAREVKRQRDEVVAEMARRDAELAASIDSEREAIRAIRDRLEEDLGDGGPAGVGRLRQELAKAQEGLKEIRQKQKAQTARAEHLLASIPEKYGRKREILLEDLRKTAVEVKEQADARRRQVLEETRKMVEFAESLPKLLEDP